MPTAEPIVEKAETTIAAAVPEPVVEAAPATQVADSIATPEPKPAPKRVRSTKPRKPRTTKTKKETGTQ
jgi:hypothetical protein